MLSSKYKIAARNIKIIKDFKGSLFVTVFDVHSHNDDSDDTADDNQLMVVDSFWYFEIKSTK